MRRIGYLVALLLFCAACGSSGSSSPVAGSKGPTGCIEAQDASGTLSQNIKGSQDGTETDGDVAAGMKSVASQMDTVTLIATGRLKTVTANAQIEAGRIRVGLLTNGTDHAITKAILGLTKDIKEINALCPA